MRLKKKSKILKCGGMYYVKQWKHTVSVVRKILQTKILVLEELNK